MGRTEREKPKLQSPDPRPSPGTPAGGRVRPAWLLVTGKAAEAASAAMLATGAHTAQTTRRAAVAARAAATAATAVAAVARVTAASASAARAAWRWTASSQATTPPSAAQKCLIKDDLHPHSTGRGHSRELTGLEEDSHPHSAGRGHAASSGRGLARARVPSLAVLHPRPEEGLAASAGWAYPPTSALIGPSPSSAHRPSDSSLSPGLPGALSPLHERHTGSQISPLVSRTMLTPPWTRRPLHERSPGPRSGVALLKAEAPSPICPVSTGTPLALGVVRTHRAAASAGPPVRPSATAARLPSTSAQPSSSPASARSASGHST